MVEATGGTVGEWTTKAAGAGDLCASRWFGINKIYNLIPPTAVSWLLQYSGSRVEHRDGFSSHK